MIELTGEVLVAVVGLSGGFAVGSAFVALLIVLDIVPRLVQLARAHRRSAIFESALLAGVIGFNCADMFDWRLSLAKGWLLAPAILQGIFVGMLAAALTEVLNVIPIVAKRLQLGRYLFYLLLAMVLGKVAGSLADWLLFQQMHQ